MQLYTYVNDTSFISESVFWELPIYVHLYPMIFIEANIFMYMYNIIQVW